jgi:hypothetical protein
VIARALAQRPEDRFADRIEEYEVVDHPLVSRGGDRNASVLELAGRGFAFITKRIVLRSDDRCLRQALQLLVGCPER